MQKMPPITARKKSQKRPGFSIEEKYAAICSKKFLLPPLFAFCARGMSRGVCPENRLPVPAFWLKQNTGVGELRRQTPPEKRFL